MAPLLAAFFQGKGPKIKISSTTRCFHSNPFAMMFVYYKSTKTPKIMYLEQWLIWCGHLAVKRVHNAAHEAWAP